MAFNRRNDEDDEFEFWMWFLTGLCVILAITLIFMGGKQ